MELEATHRVNRGFTENDVLSLSLAHPEVARVFAASGHRPAQTRSPVPRSSAPIGRFGFPATMRKTALPRSSAYNLPSSIKESRIVAEIARFWMR